MADIEYKALDTLPEVLDFDSNRDMAWALDEAVARMQQLQMSPQAIAAFRNSAGEDVWMSEGVGALYDIGYNEGDDYVLEALAAIRGKGLLPYHVIHNITNLGEMYSVLVVSKYTEEWEMDRDDLLDGIVLADVYNRNYELDDLGSIRVRPSIGGLIRES